MEDAWMEKCLVGIAKIGGEEVQFASITATLDFDLGEKGIEGVPLVNGGRVTKWTPEADTTITFEVYPLQIGAGKGFFDLLHGNETVVGGTTTATTGDKLVDSSENFTTQGVRIGDRITNVTDTTYAVVTAVDSSTTLSVSADVFTSGEVYSIVRGVEIVTGTTDGTTTDKLVDSSETFTTRIVAGDQIRNTTDNTIAYVTAVDDANTLSLSSDIMVSGDDYIIYESPQRALNNHVRDKYRVLVLWTDKSTAVKASEAIANTYYALRIGGADGHFTSVKPSFTDGDLKFTVMFKCAPYDKSQDSNLLSESCAAGGGSDALPVIANYTTANKFG